MLSELTRDYDELVAELDELTTAIAGTERDAAEALGELDDLTDADDVLRAMAEERVARNRSTLLRRRLVDVQARKNRASVALERARQAAIRDKVEQARVEIAAYVLAAYRHAIEARESVEQAQREIGMLPVDSPFDGACAELEQALARLGGSVTPDSSRAVTVTYDGFTHTRRPVGFVPFATPTKRRKFYESDLAALARRLRDRDS